MRSIHTFVVVVLLAAFLMGCSAITGSRSPKPGAYAYSGVSVDEQRNLFTGRSKNEIDVSHAKSPKWLFDQVTVYAEPVVIEDLSRNDIAYSTSDLTPLFQRAVEESISQFGRFARVQDPSHAEVIVVARLWSVNAWADTRLSEEETGSVIRPGGVDIKDMSGHEIDREGLDVHVTVVFRNLEGAEFASTRAVGRLVALNGEIMDSGTVTVEKYGSASSDRRLKIDNARIKPTELPKAMTTAVDGAIAFALIEHLEKRLWLAKADESGLRHRRDAMSLAGAGAGDDD